MGLDKEIYTAVFSSCAHITYTHFDTRLLSMGFYGYEILRHK